MARKTIGVFLIRGGAAVVETEDDGGDGREEDGGGGWGLVATPSHAVPYPCQQPLERRADTATPARRKGTKAKSRGRQSAWRVAFLWRSSAHLFGDAAPPATPPALQPVWLVDVVWTGRAPRRAGGVASSPVTAIRIAVP